MDRNRILSLTPKTKRRLLGLKRRLGDLRNNNASSSSSSSPLVSSDVVAVVASSENKNPSIDHTLTKDYTRDFDIIDIAHEEGTSSLIPPPPPPSSPPPFTFPKSVTPHPPIPTNIIPEESTTTTATHDDLAVNAARETINTIRNTLPQSLLLVNNNAPNNNATSNTRHGHNHDRDCIAPFQREEINVGPLLGSGEYSHVYEVESFCLQQQHPPSASDDSMDNATTTTSREHAKRKYMKQCEKYRETNNARYAMKHIKVEYYESSLENDDSDAYIQAACDLTLEAEILSNLAHPNIIKLRGIAHSGVEGFIQGPGGYFIIMDRLFETLDQRMRTWREDNSNDVDDDFRNHHHQKKKGRRSVEPQQHLEAGDKLDLNNDLMDEQLNIALQISAAVMYLHSHSIIFRDLKPANIGFDVRGDVKIFDFGLARIMPQNGSHYHDTFKMSGAGSPRYMSPECLCSEPYNMKADVYSFAILLWEMLAGGETPYAFARTLNELADHVVNKNGRPRIHEEWPVNIQRILECSFDDDMGVRPEMKSVHHDIKTALVALRGGNSTGLSHRSIVRRRSIESFANLNQLMLASSKEDSLCAAMSRSSHRRVPISLLRNSKSMMISRQNNTSSDGICDRSQFSLGRLPLQDSHKSSSHLLRRQRLLSRQHASWDRMQEELAKRNAEQNCMSPLVVSSSRQNAVWNMVNQESTSQGPPSLERSMLSAVESSLSSPSMQSPVNAARNDMLDRITLHRSSSSQRPANAPVVRLRRNHAIGRASLQDLTAFYPTNSSMQHSNSFHPSVQIKEEEAWDNFVETDDVDAEREMLICRDNNLGSVLRRNPASFCH